MIQLKKKTHEEYVQELAVNNPIIEVIGKYDGAKTKIKHYCKIHNRYWDASPNDILRGMGCPTCAIEKSRHKRTKSLDEYLSDLHKVNKNIAVIGEYVNRNTHILHRCLIDDYEWYATPINILSGKGCPYCANNIKRTDEEYSNYIKGINPNIMVIGKYKNANIPILHKCMVDGYEWYVAPSSIISKNKIGCPKCNGTAGEQQIQRWLDNKGIKYEVQKKFDNLYDKQKLRFDFFLPDYNIAIEYDGKQHFEPIDHFGGVAAFRKLQAHDQRKADYCKQHKIGLLRIPYNKDIDVELNNFLLNKIQ